MRGGTTLLEPNVIHRNFLALSRSSNGWKCWKGLIMKHVQVGLDVDVGWKEKWPNPLVSKKGHQMLTFVADCDRSPSNQ
jgi:hypothetical protein